MRRISPIGVFILAAAIFGTGCAEDFPAGTAEQRGVGEVSLQAGVTLEIVPGAGSRLGDTSVALRAAAPEPTLTVSTLGQDSTSLNIEVRNVPANAELQITNFVERDSTASPECDEETQGQVQCDGSADPRCATPPTTRPADEPNTIAFEWTQDKCLRTNFRVSLPGAARAEPMRVGIVGHTSSPDNSRGALDALTRRTPDYAVMLGDNAEGEKASELRDLARLVDAYDFPTYMLPGEAETTPNSRANYRVVFGPYDYNYEFKGTRFVVMYSAGGIVGSTRLFQLRSTLLRFADQTPVVVLTHTPPIDPLGARNDGFLSELEAARTLSILSEYGADLVIAGHINDTHDTGARGVDMRITSAAEHGREVLLLTAPSDPESPEELELEAISLD